MNKAIFLDRDGIINELIFEKEHGIVDSPMISSQVRLIYGITDVIKDVRKMGFLTIVCSNQPAVALGKIGVKNFHAVNEEIKKQLEAQGAKLDYQYYCMHHPFAKIEKYRVECDCRKPKPGFLLKAAKEHNIDLSKSWMVGDGVDDVLAGKKAGCKSILLANIKSLENLRIVEEQLGEIKPDFIIKKLSDAIKIIKENT